MLTGHAEESAKELPEVATEALTPMLRHYLEVKAAHPDAVAEAMEGFGVVTAVTPWDIPVLELRTVCNPVGVSDREEWDLPGAFSALEVATSALLADAPAVLRGEASR